MYNYGKCHVCGGRMEEAEIKQDFWVSGRLVVIESLPAGVCRQCGERVVKADIGRQIAALLGDQKLRRKARTMSVPVITFAKTIA